MAGLVDDVNALDHGYEAIQTVLAWGAPYYTKLAMASVGGRSPDTAICLLYTSPSPRDS